MDCCGHSEAHALASGPWMGKAATVTVGAMLAGGVEPRGSTAAARTAETASAGLEVLRKFLSVDVHSHGGKTGIRAGGIVATSSPRDLRQLT